MITFLGNCSSYTRRVSLPNLIDAELELQHRPQAALSQMLEHSPPKKPTPCTPLDTVGALSNTPNHNAPQKPKRACECTAHDEHAVDATPRKDKNKTS